MAGTGGAAAAAGGTTVVNLGVVGRGSKRLQLAPVPLPTASGPGALLCNIC